MTYMTNAFIYSQPVSQSHPQRSLHAYITCTSRFVPIVPIVLHHH